MEILYGLIVAVGLLVLVLLLLPDMRTALSSLRKCSGMPSKDQESGR
jgi:hypothetical protein